MAKEYEMMHGIVLSRIVRKSTTNLRLVETNTKMGWAAYLIDDTTLVYVKYSLSCNEDKEAGSKIWSFTLTSQELQRIEAFEHEKQTKFALVCGLGTVKSAKEMRLCILDRSELNLCLGRMGKNKYSLSVKSIPNHKLQVWGSENGVNHPLKIKRSREF